MLLINELQTLGDYIKVITCTTDHFIQLSITSSSTMHKADTGQEHELMLTSNLIRIKSDLCDFI